MSSQKVVYRRDLGDEEVFTDKLDIAKFVGKVHSNIHKVVKEDYVLAKLGDKEKKFITEMISNAYFTKSLLIPLLNDTKIKSKFYRDKGYVKISDRIDQEYKMIEEYQDKIFHAFTIRCEMISILNRNVPRNYIANLILGQMNEDEGDTYEDEQRSGMWNYIKDKLGKGEQSE